MIYIEIVTDAIEYIESNLHRKICLGELASRYYISPMHFYRIFRAVTNQTLKSYILGRKLSEAAIALKNTDRKVIDIALQYGFNSHELFTRNFLKMFNVTPSLYRKGNVSVPLMERADIIERDFKNKNKDIIVDYSFRVVKEIKLLGKEIHFCPTVSCEMEEAIGKVLDFVKNIVQGNARRLFSVIRGDRGDPKRFFCFYGIAAEGYQGDSSGLVERNIPESRYVVFRYPGNLGLVFPTVKDDLHRLIRVSKLRVNYNAGFDMIDLFPENYRQTGIFYMYIPLL